MKTPIIITLLLLALSSFVKAQTSQSSHAQPDSIIKLIPYGEGRQAGYLYTIGGKLQTPQDVQIKLLAYAPSAQEYHQAKNDITWSYVSSTGFLLSSIAAVFEFAHNNKMAGETTALVNGQPTFIYQHHSLTGAYVLTGLATAFLTSAIINFVHAAKHSDNAIKAYNHRFE
jgi:hypothetical protein